MAHCVGHVKSLAVGTEIQIAWIGAIEICISGRHLGDLRKERSGVYSEYMDRVFEPVGDIQARTIRIEQRFFAVETRLEGAEYRIIRGVDHTGKVRILVEDDGVLDWIN